MALIHLTNAFGGDSVTVKKNLAGVPAGELPAKAAELVKAAKSADRPATTVEVVKAAVNMKPAAAPSVVGAVARTTPEMASVAAGTAAAQQHKLASAIAKAAAAAAPSQAGKIVAAVCRVVPKDYRAVALAAAEAAPGSEKEILRELGTVFPNMKVDDAISTYAGNPSSFAAVLATVNTSGSQVALRGPTIAPPYVAPSGSSVNITPADSGPVPPGGRDYAKP